MTAIRVRKQTVKQAINTETGALVEASSLNSMTEEAFTLLRRQAMTARVARRRAGGRHAVLVCACCEHPVYLSRHYNEQGNRWFAHDGHAPEDCVYQEGRRHSDETIRALIYRGQQEGEEHRAMKRFLADALRRDPDVSSVDIETTKFSAVARGEWRRPDVRGLYRGVPIVFEVQLSYTFLSTVIERDEFYRREGEFIIWVFQGFNCSRSTVVDEAFFNRRNLFVLDTEAMQATLERGVLTFSGYHQEPHLVGDLIEDKWSTKLVGLRETSFPTDTYRPFFFDYPAALLDVQAQLRTLHDQERAARWRELANRYILATLDYFESEHQMYFLGPIFAVADEMEQFGQWQRGFEVLKDPLFYGHHGILAVLLSVKLKQVVSYSVASVYQVLEAGVRTSGHGLRRPYSILYLRACKLWQPAMKREQQVWIRNLAHKVKASVESGDDEYLRCTAYDEAIGLLFPELGEALSDPFGAVPLAPEEAERIAQRIAHFAGAYDEVAASSEH